MQGRRGAILAVAAALLLVAVEAVSWILPGGERRDLRLLLDLVLALPACALAVFYLAFRESSLPLSVVALAVATFGFYGLGTIYDFTAKGNAGSPLDLWLAVHAVGAVGMALIGWNLASLGRALAWTTAVGFVALVFWQTHVLLSATWFLASLWLALSPQWLRAPGPAASAREPATAG
ncbi:MAG: hypothetical protein V4510_01545 [bacterium]